MEGLRYDELEPLMHGVVTQFAEIPSGRAGLALLHADRGRMAEAGGRARRIGAGLLRDPAAQSRSG